MAGFPLKMHWDNTGKMQQLESLLQFLRASAGTAVVHLSHRNSVRLSICHMGGSVKNGAS